MHELSIADAMSQLVRRHVSPAERVLCVHMKAGPLRGIDPDTMQMAWRATCADTELEGSTLELEIAPWLLRCPQCEREWEAPSVNEACTCGCQEPHFGRCDDLLLTAIDVEDIETA
jgi:Zn finger protein HypA/HybF involved in hydrogenase expression